MTWSEYIIKNAAPHSADNEYLWFRYLSKWIDRDISPEIIDDLCSNEALTPFQRTSLKAAYTEGSETRQKIRSMNEKPNLDIINEFLRRKRERVNYSQ